MATPTSYRPRPVLRLAGMLVLAFALVAACDDDDDPETTPTPAAEETPAPDDNGQPADDDAADDEEAPADEPRAHTTPGPGEDPRSDGEIGRDVDDDEIGPFDIDVIPGGEGLPEGSGTVQAGADVYADNCARCHGPSGEEDGIGPALVSEPGPWEPGMPVTVGSYWPYAETVFDFIRRAMPFDAPGTLSDDEVYAVVAWLLHQNEIIDEDEEMNEDTLPQVEMPNRDNFFSCWPDECRPDLPD